MVLVVVVVPTKAGGIVVVAAGGGVDVTAGGIVSTEVVGAGLKDADGAQETTKMVNAGSSRRWKRCAIWGDDSKGSFRVERRITR